MQPKIFLCLFFVLLRINLLSQEYVSPTGPTQPGKAPGMHAKLVSSNGTSKTYVIVFSTNDEVKSGLTDFAQKYDVKDAHFTGIGDASSIKAGFFDYQRKMFRIIPIDTAEVTSFIGNITIFNGKPTVHAHLSAALSDGSLKGGHLLELTVGPTFEIFLTVDPTPVNKKVNKDFDAAVIDVSP